MDFPKLSLSDPCLCESGKTVGACCGWRGEVQPRPHLPPYRSRRTGASRPGCYASSLADCDGPMSGEHFMSAALLRRLEEDGGVHIRGFPWQGEGWKKLPITALASNILCKQHNSDLSALDAVGEKLVDHLERIQHEFQAGDARPWIWALNGHDVERWLLKTLGGLLLSKAGRTAAGDALTPEIPPAWVDVIPPTWGLYVVGELGHTVATEPKKYNFAPVSVAGRGVGVRAELVGHAFTLLMTEPGRPAGAVDEHSIYRPRYLSIESEGKKKVIYFHWDQVGSEHLGVNLTWSPSPPDGK